MKLLNLGLPKSGTTSLQKALSESGVRTVHWAINRKNRRPHLGRLESFVGYRMYRDHLKGLDPLQDLAEFDVITQPDMISDQYSFWPQMDHALLRSVRRHHPECTFLLLTRTPEKVARSISNWLDLQERMAKVGLPGLPAPMAREPEALLRWVTNHYDNVRDWFADDPNFVEIDIETPDVREQFEKLLGIEFSWWGRANKNKSPNKKRQWSL